MGAPKKAEIKEKDLQGFKHFKLLVPVLEQLHEHGCARDRAGNRTLHFDQHICLLLLYFFNPILTSLRGIQQASKLKKVQRILGCSRASLGSLSEASSVFDASVLPDVIRELAERLGPLRRDSDFQNIKGIITLVDGSLLKALPKMTGAMWLDDQHRAFKMHTHFELLKSVPVRMKLTDANASEREVLRANLQPDRVYVVDRGYVQYALFADIIATGSSFVCRGRDNGVYEVLEDHELSEEARAVNVIHDRTVRFTAKQATDVGLSQPLRIVEVKCQPRLKGRGGPNQGDKLQIVTDMLDVPAEIISLMYKERWNIEIHFRFFKHVLGCRHLLSHSTNGIEIQTYVAIIACLLIALWTGRKPTLRTYEMICFYFSGMADEEELLDHISKLQPQHA
jgi:hypothetical protein